MKEGDEMLITLYFIIAGSIFYTLLSPPRQEKEQLLKNQKHVIKINDSPLAKGVKQNV
jgi:preprotein translocase subunit YajC